MRDAAIEAAKPRFRPIIMTSMAFILGVVPLVLATGAGAVSYGSQSGRPMQDIQSAGAVCHDHHVSALGSYHSASGSACYVFNVAHSRRIAQHGLFSDGQAKWEGNH